MNEQVLKLLIVIKTVCCLTYFFLEIYLFKSKLGVLRCFQIRYQNLLALLILF